MTPVNQDKLWQADGIGNGNCLAACLASLLDLDLWMVPPFEQMFGRGHGYWAARRDEWLAKFFRVRLKMVEGHPESLPEFYMATGLSARHVQHSVIYSRGAMVHDPHPSRSGIISVEECWYLEPL